MLADSTHLDATKIPRLGLMAFQGRFPFLLAQAASELSIPVSAFGVKGITSPELSDHVEQMHWMKLGQLNRFIEKLHEEDIHHVVMAGRVEHSCIWRYRGFDRRSLKLLGSVVNRKANTLLLAVVDELASENIEVIDSSMLIKGCMPEKGLLTPNRPLNEQEHSDIEFGYPIARRIAGMDIGQTVVVKDRAVVAVESLEGTDETIRRAGAITEGGNLVIKVSKPHQDSRFDIPVIGPNTVKVLAESGGGCISIMAKETLFFDQEEAVQLAEESGIGIQAI